MRRAGEPSKLKEIACKIRSPVICNNLAAWNKMKSLQTLTILLLKFMERGSIKHFFSSI